MQKFIIVETEEDKAHFASSGLDTLAEVEVSGRNGALSHMTSITMTEDAYVIYVVGTTSEEDRFFKDWLVDADLLARRGNNISQGSILPAAPSIEAACRNDAWVSRLKQRLQGSIDS